MTEQEQRIAIAQACGWHQPSPPTNTGMMCKGSDESLHFPPDYLHDLNVVREAIIEIIDPHLIQEFHEALYDILERHWTPKRWYMFSTPARFYAFTTATAGQLSEAVLRTIGKWKETILATAATSKPEAG